MSNKAEQNRESLATRVAGRLKGYERHPATPSALRRFINFLRLSGDFERRFVRDPLRSVPEFRDAVPELSATSRFGLIHVDCDLYQSTMDALEPLFAKHLVSEGAALLFDDWNCNRASKQLGERRAWSELSAKYDVDYSDEGGYGRAGHRLTVHRYRGLPES
jgi:hypothetical protein